MNKTLSPFLILLAAILWGTTGTTQAFAPEAAHPIAIGATRLAVGGVFLLLLIEGQLNLKHWSIRSTLLAALSMALYQPFFFSAVLMTGVAIGTVVAIGSAPILSGVIEWVFKRKHPTRVWWYATLTSIVGCLLLFMNQGSIDVDTLGIILAIGAGLTFAVFTVVSSDLVEKHSSLSVMAVVFTLSAIFLSPFLFIYDMSWIASFQGFSVSLYLGVAATGFAYLLFARGLVYVSSSTAVALSLAEPLTATLLGVFLLGESLHATSWKGMVLIIVGIGMLVVLARKSEHE
ncbi:EamA family transporter [Alkalihalobacillus hemicellulosilyticus]|uniref:Permease of the drug/metabolite transporter n=1 Tax=Halalkalibacter hemicellulosilyticusJCM 9152 TaxID=1236971 RepID=W4QML5_9BACI|nr:EamA family transporter [Halalkalibacter hemicellulosilyticus]GAE32579.1 permease of the drug/metabolite transporter [Halalkalibacter hemicellulosilyticusJCM 9152]